MLRIWQSIDGDGEAVDKGTQGFAAHLKLAA
jgi:hypothetical protein